MKIILIYIAITFICLLIGLWPYLRALVDEIVMDTKRTRTK